MNENKRQIIIPHLDIDKWDFDDTIDNIIIKLNGLKDNGAEGLEVYRDGKEGLTFTPWRLETDEEYNYRLEKEQKEFEAKLKVEQEQKTKEARYKQYQQLKAEFES